MRKIADLLHEAYGEAYAVAPADYLHFKKSCRKIQSLPRRPQPELRDVAVPFGSCSPRTIILKKQPAISAAVKTDYLYDPKPILPHRADKICPRVIFPSEKDRSPPVGKYNIRDAFDALKSAYSALISNYEEVEHAERRPIAYFYPEYAPAKLPCRTMRSDRKIMLYEPGKAEGPGPAAHIPSRYAKPRLSQLEKNLVDEDLRLRKARADGAKRYALRMLSAGYIETGDI